MSDYNAVVWMDHSEARIFHVDAKEAGATALRGHRQHLQHRAGVLGDGSVPADIAFFDDIGDALEGAGKVLIVGPGAAKLELIRHAIRYLPQIASKIAGVETVEHPGDIQMAAYARQYFRAGDRMRPLQPATDSCCGGNCGG